MKIPPRVRDRVGGLIDWIDDFYEAWHASRVVRSVDCEIHETPDGTLLFPRSSRGAPGGSSSNVDFELLKDPSGDNVIRVVLGTVNSQIPTGMTLGDAADAHYLISATAGSGYVYLVVTINPLTDAITSITIDKAASVPADTDTIGYQSLGTYSYIGGVLSVTGAVGSLGFASCGGHHFFWGI